MLSYGVRTKGENIYTVRLADDEAGLRMNSCKTNHLSIGEQTGDLDLGNNQTLAICDDDKNT
jgi:hypothetical protein